MPCQADACYVLVPMAGRLPRVAGRVLRATGAAPGWCCATSGGPEARRPCRRGRGKAHGRGGRTGRLIPGRGVPPVVGCRARTVLRLVPRPMAGRVPRVAGRVLRATGAGRGWRCDSSWGCRRARGPCRVDGERPRQEGRTGEPNPRAGGGDPRRRRDGSATPSWASGEAMAGRVPRVAGRVPQARRGRGRPRWCFGNRGRPHSPPGITGRRLNLARRAAGEGRQ